MDLVLQREVEGEALNAFVVVDLHFGRVFVGLQVLDDIREPDGQTIISAITETKRHQGIKTKLIHRSVRDD